MNFQLGRNITDYFSRVNSGASGINNNVSVPPSSANNIIPIANNLNNFSTQTEGMLESESSFSVGTSFGVGSAISSVNSAILDYSTQQNLLKSEQGLGPNGHAFDANVHAQMQANHDNMIATIGSGLIAAGSLAGPEGLIAGTIAAGALELTQYGSPVNQNTTMSTEGNLVNANQ